MLYRIMLIVHTCKVLKGNATHAWQDNLRKDEAGVVLGKMLLESFFPQNN